MAIKRTIQRQILVKPTGVNDAGAGAKAMAQAGQNIANTISNVTSFIDDKQLEDAVLDAEIKGKQIGTQTVKDKNGNLVPKPLDLMTLNSFTTDIYNKRNLRKAQQYFKNQAINSYGLSLQNHAVDTANNFLAMNEGKVDEKGNLMVRNAGDSYIDGIKKQVAPEVFAAISPTLSNIWGKATRKASAIQIKNVKETNIFNATKGLQNILQMEINSISNGGNDEDAYIIETTKPKMFDIIDQNVSSKIQGEKIKLEYNQSLQTGVAVNAVDLAYEAGVSIPELLNMSISTGKNFANNVDIDGDKIATAMRAKIAIYEQIEKDILQKRTYDSRVLVSNLELKVQNGIVVEESDVAKLTDIDQNRFSKFKNAYNKTSDNNASKIFNLQIENKIDRIKADIIKPAKPDLVNELSGETQPILKNRAKVSLINELVEKVGHKDMSNTNRRKILNLVNDVAKQTLKLDNDTFKANIERMFNGSVSTIMIPPETLLTPQYIDSLKARNVIGITPENAYTEESWIKRVNTYAKDYRIKQNEIYQASQLGYNLENNIGYTNPQKTYMDNKLMPKTFVMNGNTVDIDILNSNEDIRNESLKIVTSHVTSLGYIPKNISQIFNSSKTLNDENFAYAKSAYLTIKNAIIKKYQNGESMFELIVGDKFSAVDSNLMESAMMYDNASEFRQVHSTTSVNRNLSQHIGSDQNETITFDESFNRVKNYLDANFIESFWVDKVGGADYEDRALKAWVEQSGASNFDEAVFKDPFIKNEIIKNVKSQIASGSVAPGQVGLDVAVKKALYKFAGNLSVHQDQFGDTHLIRGVSIVKAAQSTVPSGGPIVTKEIIKKDMLRRYGETFSAGTDSEINDAIDNGNIMFVKSNDVVGEPTYKAIAITNDGRYETIADNYSWNYNGSQLQSDYNEALQKISDGGVRKLLGSLDFMSRNNLEAVMSSIESNRDYTESLKYLVNSYNSIAQSINSAPVVYSQILPYLNQGRSDKELRTFFDNFRLLRLDIR